ncbi:glutamine synthetase family protein [Kitasatospora sp. CB01950]|uniref:glutamine synthetase family protein n=1 Tax=Kitasatospora sp. CB01950 TaxID=1703930 RepID=UPI00095E24D2|nr:glutamine synthetase family protein [Kitasatospora sp. CB01950]OKJ06638.1 glutamine synthetase [Kitasatospora sp. CB01950]
MSTEKPRAERAAEARLAATRIEAEGVDGVIVGWVDNAGVTRVKTVPVRGLESAARWGVGAAPCFDAFLVDDSLAPSGSPVGDLRLVPDVAALHRLAAQPGWAWAPGDRWTQQGEPHPGCQRQFARRTAEALAERGLTVKAGIEVEWIVEGGGDGPAYGMRRVVANSDYLRDLLRTLREQKLTVLQLHPEYSDGQFELSVAPGGPVEAADTALLVRHTVQAVSLRHGLRASFAPVTAPGGVGNGGHLHLSLWRDGQNLGHGGSGPHGLTREAEAFFAGVLAELPALLALGAPSVASYLRLVPGHWSGPHRCWGLENREAALRLITGSAPEQANAEVKCFDAAANPYLAVGGVLAAGLAGLGAALSLPAETTGDPDGVAERLPARLDEAVDALRKSEVLRTAMGEPLWQSVIDVREAEIARFADHEPARIIEAVRYRY